MADGTAAKEKPKESQWAGAIREPEEAAEGTGNTKTVCSRNEGESSRCSSESDQLKK